MNRISILILEDDPQTLSVIFEVLRGFDCVFEPVVLSRYDQVEKLVNAQDIRYDLILLDRDCGAGGSFHVLDIERFGPERIIAISSVPPYNEQARARGVARIIDKDYHKFDEFAQKLTVEIRGLLG
jgi:CheY-like chemotaxis protein